MQQHSSTRPFQPSAAPGPATRNSGASEPSLAHVSLAGLTQRCRAESERFFRSQPFDQRPAYELFRRALVERDEATWEALYEHYHALVQSWVRRSSAFAVSGESCDYFVNAAFARFWRAITPERFGAFPTLASLLNYLQRCARCAVLDAARGYTAAETLPDDTDDGEIAQQHPMEDLVLARIRQQELWRYVDSQLSSAAERVVMFQSFVLGMKPRDIYRCYPQLFNTVNEVYLAKRYVLERLSRDQHVRELLG